MNIIIRRTVITIGIVALVLLLNACGGINDRGNSPSAHEQQTGSYQGSPNNCVSTGGFPGDVSFNFHETSQEERARVWQCLKNVRQLDSVSAPIVGEGGSLSNDVFVTLRANVASLDLIPRESQWRSNPYIMPVISASLRGEFLPLAWGDVKEVTEYTYDLDVSVAYDFILFAGRSVDIRLEVYLLYTHTETPYYEVFHIANSRVTHIAFD